MYMYLLGLYSVYIILIYLDMFIVIWMIVLCCIYKLINFLLNNIEYIRLPSLVFRQNNLLSTQKSRHHECDLHSLCTYIS